MLSPMQGDETTINWYSYDKLRPTAPEETYISSSVWPQQLQFGNPVDVWFLGAWCPAAVLTASSRDTTKVLLFGESCAQPGVNAVRGKRQRTRSDCSAVCCEKGNPQHASKLASLMLFLTLLLAVVCAWKHTVPACGYTDKCIFCCLPCCRPPAHSQR
jgi:hypothetical protein